MLKGHFSIFLSHISCHENKPSNNCEHNTDINDKSIFDKIDRVYFGVLQKTIKLDK